VKLFSRYATLSACLLLWTTTCWADPYDEGRELYKAGRYAEAAAKLEQATREDPRNAKAWWQLNFAYNKLERHADALRAVQKAHEIDPSNGFASEPGKYEEVLTRLQSKVSGTTPTQTAPPRTTAPAFTAPTRAGSGRGSLTQQLTRGDVYVEPGMNVDAARLQRVAQELRPTIVKFVVFNSRSGSATLSREASRIRDYLNVGKGYVLVASRAAVSASSQSLNRDTLRQLTKEVAPQIETGDYTGGLERLARGLVQTRAAQTTRTRNTWIIVLAVIGGVIVVWIVLRAAANARAMAARREPLERLKSDVISQLNFLDDQLPLLDSSTAARVKEARITAGTKLDEAARIMARAKSDRQLGSAQNLLDQAQSEIGRARSLIDRSLSGAADTGADTLPSAGKNGMSAATGRDTDWNAIPEGERGVCFFCSRPSRVDELTPVTVNLDGERQKVLACPDDLATIKTGEMPRIRAFEREGRYVPWYADDRYDPYRDYYGRGYDNRSLLSDLVTLSLIDHIFWGWHRPVGWGWGGGYVFYPEHEHYRDYYSGHAAGHGDFDRTADAAGTDFLQNSGGDLSGGDDSEAGGVDFLGSDQS